RPVTVAVKTVVPSMPTVIVCPLTEMLIARTVPRNDGTDVVLATTVAPDLIVTLSDGNVLNPTDTPARPATPRPPPACPTEEPRTGGASGANAAPPAPFPPSIDRLNVAVTPSVRTGEPYSNVPAVDCVAGVRITLAPLVLAAPLKRQPVPGAGSRVVPL